MEILFIKRKGQGGLDVPRTSYVTQIECGTYDYDSNPFYPTNSNYKFCILECQIMSPQMHKTIEKLRDIGTVSFIKLIHFYDHKINS